MADLERPDLPSLSTGPGRGRRKQVFFVFMSATVLAVVIFLLGVSVGRGVRKTGSADSGQPGDTTVSAAPPAARPGGTAGTPPEGVSSAATSATDPSRAPAPPPVSEPVPPPPAVSEPSSTANAPKPSANAPAGKSSSQKPKSGAPAAGEYSVQVGAYNSMGAAQSLMASVKARSKDYPVSVVTMPETDPIRYRVFVGPYPTRADADSVASRLKRDGFQALIKH